MRLFFSLAVRGMQCKDASGILDEELLCPTTDAFFKKRTADQTAAVAKLQQVLDVFVACGSRCSETPRNGGRPMPAAVSRGRRAAAA